MNIHSGLQAFLKDPHSYPEATTRVELRETHISQVYLTDHSAYKIKKPWKLPFLDYSSLEARHAACLAELELNRRFSQDIYRGVVAITQEERGLAWNGPGPVLDYAVWMRRIPDDCLMDARLRSRSFGADERERLITHLAACYAKAPHGLIDASSWWQRLQRLIEENRASLYELSLHLGLDPMPWQAMGSRQLLFIQLFRDLLMERVARNLVIEGHGDLRPEHIVLEDQVAMIDGIEFNRDLRILDQADELSFLAMECAAMGFAELGAIIRARVLEQLQDHAPPELLAFYESYRAMVRAKVNAIKAEQLPKDQRAATLELVETYHQLAHNTLHAFLPPFTFLVAGAMGSGKTTLARSLKQELSAVHVESDQIRRETLGRSQQDFAYGQGPYTVEARRGIYQRMKERMQSQLQAGMNVIVDASFSQPDYVNMIVEPLQREGRPFLIVLCECSDEEALARIGRRLHAGTSPSEARPDLFREQKAKGNWTFPDLPLCRVNTELPQHEELRKVFQAAKEVLRKGLRQGSKSLLEDDRHLRK